jgi:prepilin-type N-terminal cleavage/methylation domain-containing protein
VERFPNHGSPICPRRRSAFTLVEVLIVVVILAVLAAVLVPAFSSSADDAKSAALRHDLRSLRDILELYRAHHGGQSPLLQERTLRQLLLSTDASGNAGTGPNYPYGPYLVNDLPPNPYVEDPLETRAVAQAGTVPPTAPEGSTGWLYDEDTGQIWANIDEFIDE